MTHNNVKLGARSYKVIVGENVYADVGRIVRPLELGTDAFIVTNPHIASLYAAPIARSFSRSGITAHTIYIPDSERAKSIHCLTRILRSLARHDILCRPFIAALGGGVAGDVAGFAAAVYKRGIPYIQLPTTLLAQVDSSIGGKVAVDLPEAKNLAGAFYQPRLVITDIASLATLPVRQIASGLAEVIKYGVIADPALFAFLERSADALIYGDAAALTHVVNASAKIKAGYVERDEFDRCGVRAHLNFGHTIGHAIEAAAGYSSLYSHGEAVAIGMAAACDISRSLKIISSRDALRICALIDAMRLPTTIRRIDKRAILSSYLHDKKFINKKNRFILPVKIGKTRIVENIPAEIIKEAVLHRYAKT